MKKVVLVAALLAVFVGSAYARPFMSISGSFGFYGGATKRISGAEYGYYDDIKGIETDIGAPFTINIGYLNEQSYGDGFGVSVFYTKHIVADAGIESISGEWQSDKTYYPVDNKAQITSQQAGVSFTYKPNSSFAINLGVGTDVGSKIVFPMKNTEVERKLNGIYMPVSIDWGSFFDNFGFYGTLGASINIAGDEYLSNYVFIGFKVKYLISW